MDKNLKQVAFNVPASVAERLIKLQEVKSDVLTQHNLIATINIMKNALSFDMEQVDDKAYEALYTAVQRLTEITIYKPIDQRSFPEFVRDEILFRLEDTSLEKIGEHSLLVLFDSALADGSLTTNTEESLNYIRSFWGDFIEDDMEDYDAARVFDKPEEFLLQQTLRMASRIIKAILDRGGEVLINIMKNALSFDMEQVDDKAYEALYTLVQHLTEITIYKPIDQRSFPEFVRDEMIPKEIFATLLKGIDPFDLSDLVY